MSCRVEQSPQTLLVADGSRAREVLAHVRRGSATLSCHGGEQGEVGGEEGGGAVRRVKNKHSIGQVEGVDDSQE